MKTQLSAQTWTWTLDFDLGFVNVADLFNATFCSHCKVISHDCTLVHFDKNNLVFLSDNHHFTSFDDQKDFMVQGKFTDNNSLSVVCSNIRLEDTNKIYEVGNTGSECK